jgi:hypothetical protein
MAQHARTAWRQSLREHPAVAAWARTGAQSRPSAVEALKLCRKSATYRLAGVGSEGGSLIAKRARRETASVERTVYAEILPEIPLSGLAFHGFLDEVDDDCCWLFLEDAGDAQPASADEVDPVRTARWLATLHSAAADLAATATLPDRGPDHHLAQLRRLRASIVEHFDNPVFGQSARETLHRIRGQCDLVESHWQEIDAFCGELPRTLVHGDFVRKNLRMRPGTEDMLVFDWEFAGRAIPAVDFCASESSRVPLQVDLETYREEVRSRWPGLDRPTLERMHAMGLLFRWGIVSMEWRSYRLAYPWVDRVIADLRVYQRRAQRSIRALGWSD